MAGSSLPPNAMNMIKGFVGDAPAPAPPPPATSLPPKAMDMIKGFLPPAAPAPAPAPAPKTSRNVLRHRQARAQPPSPPPDAAALLAAFAAEPAPAAPPPPRDGLPEVEPLGTAAVFALLRPDGPRHAVLDGFLGDARATRAAAAAARLRDGGALAAARVGQGAARRSDGSARSDDITFFEDLKPGADADLAAVCRELRKLRSSLSRGGCWEARAAGVLDLDATRTSTQIAAYAVDGRYARHADAPPDDRARAGGATTTRRVTCVYYLNERWTPADGGALRIHAGDWTGDGAGFVDVLPKLDRLVLFRSDVDHEVLPCFRPRLALTQWWYGALDPAPRAPPRLSVAPPLPSSPSGGERIFVSVASYRDPETEKTLAHLFATAEDPRRVRVALVSQYDALAGADDAFLGPLYNGDFEKLVTRVRVDFRDAAGPCPARAVAQAHHRGEPYVLQIDSHMRFRFHWDSYLVETLKSLKSDKAILTAYPVGYEVSPEETLPAETRPTLLCPASFGPDGMLRIAGRLLRAAPAAPVPSPLWCAGFAFSTAAALRDAPYDGSLRHLFFGEELLMAARLWTAGFDFFAPPQNVVYHLWSRAGRRTVDDDAASAPRAADRAAALARVEAALDGTDASGLGSARPLAAFFRRVGVDFAGKRLLPGAEHGGLPPASFAVGAKFVEDLAALAAPRAAAETQVSAPADREIPNLGDEDEDPDALAALVDVD